MNSSCSYLSRRRFLYGTAVTAGALMLAGCSSDAGDDESGGTDGRRSVEGEGSATEPVPQPSTFAEAPSLAAQVETGDLPPVAERLPANPYVVPHRWLQPGQYGGVLLMMTPSSSESSIKEYMYGHSLLRWLNDGLDLGPGLVESWESNDDASQWTFHFRNGLKWSDGEPWTTEDILFWWEDMVLNDDHSEGPPDEARSGTGTVMELTAPDEITIVMQFDAPAPLTPFHLARWVNAGNGPTWMAPKHYLQQFHPTYNPDVPDDWATADGEFDQRRDWAINPECPTMTGWRLVDYQEGTSLTLERNPYYWCVDSDGNQLPYLDRLDIAVVDDPEVARLQMQEGRVDYVHGNFAGLTLDDISGLRQSERRSQLEVRLWDGGSGTGSIFFFNYDYREPAVRELIRKPAFRQALSHAIDRDEMQRAIYYDTGEQTTGTYSPKALDFLVNDEAERVYADWRDSYLRHDPERAKSLLDDLGVVDTNGDGLRELPDGSELTIRLDFPADTSDEHLEKNNRLERDWGAIELQVRQNPVSPEAWPVQWEAGELMTHTAWENSGGTHEILVEPQVLVPLSGFPSWWAPLHANYHALRGTQEAERVRGTDPYERTPPNIEPEPDGPITRLWELHDQSKIEPDALQRYKLVWEMIKIHLQDGPFFIGTVANTPTLVLVHNDLRNIPRKENLTLGGLVNPWTHPTPAVYDPETWYWSNPDQHQ